MTRVRSALATLACLLFMVTASDASASPAVGALFVNGSHCCSASVVHSPAGDLVLTAAHCIHDGEDGGYRTGITFMPGYHDGVAPLGAWTANRLIVDPRWAGSSDPDLDVGFATVHQAGNPRVLQGHHGAAEHPSELYATAISGG